MTHRIVCDIPTVYQHQSLTKFNLNNQKNGNGSYRGSQDFYSYEDAKDYLIDRAEKYFDNDKQLQEALQDIENCGMLTIDAATARIEEIETFEEILKSDHPLLKD